MLIRPEDFPPPESGSFSPRNLEKLDPVPDPYLNKARFARPQIHDAARIHQVIADRLNKTGMRLGMRVGIGTLFQLPGFRIAKKMSLCRPGDAVRPVQAGVEPLRLFGAHI